MKCCHTHMLLILNCFQNYNSIFDLGYFAALFWYSGIYHQLHDCINPNWGFYAILPWLSSGVVVYLICQAYRSLQKCSSLAFDDYHLFILKNFTRKFPWSTCNLCSLTGEKWFTLVDQEPHLSSNSFVYDWDDSSAMSLVDYGFITSCFPRSR